MFISVINGFIKRVVLIDTLRMLKPVHHKIILIRGSLMDGFNSVFMHDSPRY